MCVNPKHWAAATAQLLKEGFIAYYIEDEGVFIFVEGPKKAITVNISCIEVAYLSSKWEHNGDGDADEYIKTQIEK